MNIIETESNSIKEAFSLLMGESGNYFAEEVITTGKLSQNSYNAVCDNIQFNGKQSIQKYFGLIHWYYLQSKI